MLNNELVSKYLKELNLDCYLIYDFRKSNPVGRSILKFNTTTTRRWITIFTKEGEVHFIIPKLEQTIFRNLRGIKHTYTTYSELKKILEQILRDYRTVALEYSENNNLALLDNVPAGFIELIKEVNPSAQITSSANLTQYIASSWSKSGYLSHKKAAEILKDVADKTILYIHDKLRNKKNITDFQASEFVLNEYKKHSLITDDNICIVSTNQRSGNPHYWPTLERNYTIKPNSVLLLDLWAKADKKDSIYADITIMAWIGPKPVPKHLAKIWQIVTDARNIGVEYVKKNINRDLRGFEVDKEVRAYISQNGFKEEFLHRTGHSIDRLDHGGGANLDDFESHDTRLLIPNTGFSIEPGIYTKQFGVRSEIDVYIHPDKKVEITTFFQEDLILL